MMPDWSKAPEWAKYFTLDAKGKFEWWEDEPTYDAIDGNWFDDSINNKGWHSFAGRLDIPKPFVQERPV